MSNIKEATTTTAKVFIVPNSLNKIGEFMMPEPRREFLTKLAELNHWDNVTDETLLVQLWFHDKETLHTDNLIDHGFRVTFDEVEYPAHVDSSFQFLPVSLFEGKKEGDKVHIDMPVTIRDKEGKFDAVIHMDVILDQLNYRYRRFGTFERVLYDLKDAYVSK